MRMSSRISLSDLFILVIFAFPLALPINLVIWGIKKLFDHGVTPVYLSTFLFAYIPVLTLLILVKIRSDHP